MAREKSKSAQDAAFARGEIGVDGGDVEERKDEAEVERDKAREQFMRGKSYLGREFLSWLLWRTESGDPILHHENQALTVVFADRLVLRGIAGEVVETTMRGAMAPYSPLVRRSLARGLLIHQARLRLMHGEFPFEVTIDAEHFDLKGAKLPELTKEEEEDRLQERLLLSERLGELVQALIELFLRVRTAKRWSKDVADMKQWMAEAAS